MYPTYFLQELWQGEWHEVGWRASSPNSLADLRKHGAALCNSGIPVRLVRLSVYADGQPELIAGPLDLAEMAA